MYHEHCGREIRHGAWQTIDLELSVVVNHTAGVLSSFKTYPIGPWPPTVLEPPQWPHTPQADVRFAHARSHAYALVCVSAMLDAPAAAHSR